MERIDVASFAKTHEEPRGNNDKYWVDDKLVKYNDPTCPDTDVMESISSFILMYLGIKQVDVELGYNSNSEMVEEMNLNDNNCCIIDSFLTEEGDTLVGLPSKWSKILSDDEQKNISGCFYKMFKIFSEFRDISEEDLENMKRDYVRQVLGDCIIGNEDRRLKNIGVIYNEKHGSYRLAPSFDNALAFSAFAFSGDDAYCFVGEQNFRSEDIIDYIVNHYLDYISDIPEKLEELSSFGIDIVLKNYEEDIPLEKREYICASIKENSVYINKKINDTKKMNK